MTQRRNRHFITLRARMQHLGDCDQTSNRLDNHRGCLCTRRRGL